MAYGDPDVADVWEHFHELVNMSSPELRDWLLTMPDQMDTYASQPDLDVHALGLAMLPVLDKRRTDLTPSDVDLMREVVDLISGRLANPPEDDVTNEPWRDTLLTLGHDPTRPDSPRGPDAQV